LKIYKIIIKMEQKEIISITFGEQVENHHGMEKIGELAKEGYKTSELKVIKFKIHFQQNLIYTL